MTTTRRRAALHLTLPNPGMTRSDSADSLLMTPGPHTPLPYEFFAPVMAEPSTKIGSKRGREEDDAEEQREWNAEEMDVLQSTLLAPFKPVSTHYPPGELPPANVIDELTNQILAYARDWARSFDATRKKLFSLALTESKFGHEIEETRKLPREERSQRPGLRRVDSMDFLDQGEDQSVGRALRLSTSLQNTAKQESFTLARSASVNTGLAEASSTSPSPPPCAAITVTPASPNPPSPVRRRPSFRGPSSASKPLRPTSLLQRGRSFTADDLKAEAESEVSAEAAPPLITRLSRSQSSLSALQVRPHAAQKMFLAPAKPSTTDRSALAMPLPIETSEPKSIKDTSSWSDSEDESLATKPRVVKKMRAARVLKLDQDDSGLRSPFEEKPEPQFC